MSLFDAQALTRLQTEFRRSMRNLLLGLCRDIERHYADVAARLDLPVDYFRFLAHHLDGAAYSNWKVVGWIESLNDLVYFLDLLAQVRNDRDQRGFAEQLFAECEQNFFENSYLEELFPLERAQARGLAGRLQRLCRRLALEVTQESLFFDPGWALEWMRRHGRLSWFVPGRLEASFERAEQAFTVPIGIDGDMLMAPAAARRAVGRPRRRLTFRLTDDEIALRSGRTFPLCNRRGATMHWQWRRKEARVAATAASGTVTIGPTLHYGKNRQPKSLSNTGATQVARIARAWRTIRRAWPEGHALLELLTSRIIPLKASGVVSFSYRHRPGLSFVNSFERDNLDLIDDLIHENSHHHLNLLLRKHSLYHGDRNQQIFYSPWRKTLRPVRGILHAAFTFTMGALLFARLSAWAETAQGKVQWREAGLTGRDLVRARFRCLEEIESVRYSLRDLEYAGRHLKWITVPGARLVKQLEEAIMKAEHQMVRHRRTVLASPFGANLRKHMSELQQARQAYGPMRIDQA
ncbi:MAG TPA: HEXXH motif-containing putative peptide modification protein [Nitrospira sp.]|nr:HEXXH motif-containing putative peptide modification protein [Nitrospira sp.]